MPCDTLEGAMGELAKTLQLAIGRGAPEAGQLAALFSDSGATGTWYNVLRNDPAQVSLLTEWAYERCRVVPYPLLNRTVPAVVTQSFVETIIGHHGPDVFDRMLAGYYPVPLFQIGPAFVFGHFDPAFRFHEILPPHLSIPVWLTFADYVGVLQDLRAQVQIAGLATQVGTGGHKPSIGFQEFLGRKGHAMNPASPLSRLREFLEWAKTLPTLSSADEQSITALLLKDDLNEISELTPDIQLFASHILLGELVTKTDNLSIDPAIKQGIDEDLVADNQLCPFALTDNLCFILSDVHPSPKLEDDFHNRAYRRVIGVLVPAHQFQSACASKANIDVLYSASQDGFQDAEPPAFELSPNAYSENFKISDDMLDDPEELLRIIMYTAGVSRAADVHAEFLNGVYRIRMKVDGVVRTAMELPGRVHDGLAARIKTFSGIALESIRAADGRFMFCIGTRRIDVRVKLIFDHARKARFALRLLDKSMPIKTVASLGLMAHEITALSDVYQSTDGLLVVCGATSEGKSTTLFAIMNEINREGKVIYSLEDPPEYTVPGVCQIYCTSDPAEVRDNRPLFAHAIKGLLRMAPNYVSVGEVRDQATAEEFLDIGLSGHFGMCTFHAKDVFSAIQRMLSFSLNPVDLANSTKMIVAQRLIRKVCRCHKLEPITDGQRSYFDSAGVKIPAGITKIPVPVGCEQCRSSGYLGQMAVMEMLHITEEIATLIIEVGSAEKDSSMAKLKETAVSQGFRSVFQNALNKVLLGQTTLEEVDRHIRRVKRGRRTTAEEGEAPPAIPFRKAS
jgi:type II secretory ATPase GspE/PulE/Tfp pilus assembly ATPase PilB-like protein